MTACHRDFVNDCVPPKSSQLMNFQKTLHLLEFSWNFAKIRHFNFLQFSWLGSQKSDPSIFSKFHDPGKRKKKSKTNEAFHILKMKTPFEKEPHFENESSFRNPFWKWKHTYGKVRICKWQCTLIRGVIVIHPGLKYGLFHYTLVHFDHILSGIQISTIADFSSMHSGDFCLLLQISSFAWLFLCYHGIIWYISVSL